MPPDPKRREVPEVRYQREAIDIIKDYCTENGSSFVPILKGFYDDDIIEEETIIEWHKAESGPVRDSASAFVKWLQEAEEESEDDSDDD
ncbi:hypothetical protein HK101_006505 [Irineochytrium annulatum]|nr:hypothetical protein HK101_006505 [Irineochytrium annulatum]